MVEIAHGDSEPKGGSDSESIQEANAYLQRAETLLSNMHGIARAFLGGAGLLVLFQFVLSTVLASIGKFALALDLWIAQVGFAALLMIAVLLPLYALYLLVEDIVGFYFSASQPGVGSSEFYPSLVLPPVLFGRSQISDTDPKVADGDRDPKVAAIETEQKKDSYVVHALGTDKDEFAPTLPSALLKVRAKRRIAVEEIAAVEAMQLRCTLHLRRIVLRYAKAFLMLVWTTFILSSVAIYADHSIKPASTNLSPVPEELEVVVVALGFLTWSGVLWWLVRQPINWIYRETSKKYSSYLVENDSHLNAFEARVRASAAVASAYSLLLLIRVLIAPYPQTASITPPADPLSVIVILGSPCLAYLWVWKKDRARRPLVEIVNSDAARTE